MTVGEMMIDEAVGSVHCGMRVFRLIEFGEGRLVTDVLCHSSMWLSACSLPLHCDSNIPQRFSGKHALVHSYK